MLKEILKDYSDKYGYIHDCYELILSMEKEGKTASEINNLLNDINNNNIRVYETINRENEKLKKINNITTKNQNDEKDFVFEEDIIPVIEEQIDENTQKDEHINHYQVQISELINNNYSYEELVKILDSIPESKIIDVLNHLMLDYKNKELQVKSLLDPKENEEWNNSVKEEMNIYVELRNDILKYKKSLSEEELIENDKKINLLFDFDTIDQDLSNIDINQYYDLLALLEGLQKGIFKNQKTFTLIGLNRAVQEVRNVQVRVMYDKIDNDTYTVYYIFPKKDCDNFYHEKLVNRCKAYFNKKQSLIKDYMDSTTKEECLNTNNEKANEVVKVLTKRKDVK